MKIKQLHQIGMLLTLIMLSACSKQSGKTEATSNTPSQGSSISFVNLYLVGDKQWSVDWYRIIEFENTGKVGIKAFQGNWKIKDDLGAMLADQEVRFTSDTPFSTPEGDKLAHVIAPGEKFVIVNKNDASIDSDFATTKDNLPKCIYGYADLVKNAKLEDCRVTRKITFEVKKLVTQ